MICWELGKTDVKRTVTFWDAILGFHQFFFFHVRWSFFSLRTCVLCRSSSNPDMHTVGDEDDEVNKLARGLDRTSSMRAGTINVIFGSECMDHY